MAFRKEKITEQLVHLAGMFLALESNNTSLITVTNARLSDDLKRATILLSIYPMEKEVEALRFVKRKELEFRKYAGDRLRALRIPRITFDLDTGEKNRQRIDELSRNA